jgi:thermitase
MPARLRLLLGALVLALALAPSAAAAEVSISLDPGGTRADADRIAARLGGHVVDAIPRLRAYLVELPARSRPRAFARALSLEPLVRSAEPNTANQLDFQVDDIYRHLQTYLTDIDAEAGWDITLGSASVVIAVVDTGVLLDHPDLVGKVVPGADVAEDDDDPTDTLGHGTLVAGIAAAIANNSAGIAGVCPNCTILAVKAAKDGANTLSKFDSAEGIVWAADHGANVVNLSFGSPTDDQVQADAVAYALARGVVVVAAAGNRGTDVPQYPAASPGVIAVAGTNDPYRLWASSSFGAWVDIAAPAYRLISTFADGGYVVGTGTSFAAPIVAAAAGLALTVAPGAPPAQVTDWITTGSLPLVDTAIRRLNLPRMLRRALGGPVEPDPPPPLVFRPFAISPGAWFVDDYRMPTAGKPFAVGAYVVRDDTDGVVESGLVSCKARIGTRQLHVREVTFVDGVARCVFRVPPRTGKKTVTGTFVVEALGGRVEQTFQALVRRFSRGG